MGIRSYIASRTVQFLAANSQWEGHERNTFRRRPYVDLSTPDKQLNYGDRDALLSESRNLRQTYGIASNVLRTFGNYCVGQCEADWSSGDEAWDEQAEAFWMDSMANIDATGQDDLPSMARKGIGLMIGDGDVGFIKTLKAGFPQLIPVEADRIRNLSTHLDVDKDDGWVGGVRVDAMGRSLAYRIWQRGFIYGFRDMQVVTAQDFVHLKDPDRFDGVRGVTHFSRGALNHMRDLKEIVEAEKKSVKVASKLALLIKTMAGGIGSSAVNLFGSKQTDPGNNYTEEVPDGIIKRLLPGEDATVFESKRPSENVMKLIEFVIRDIAISLDLPFGWVWSMAGLPGPAVRMDSVRAERTFNRTMDLIERIFLNVVCSWVINWGMQSGRVPFNPNWRRWKWQRPAHVSIDYGRESKADLEEHARGWLSGQDAAAARGGNFYKTIEEKIRETKYTIERCKAEGVPIEMVMAFPTTKSEAEIDAMEKQQEQPIPMEEEKA
jgi:capsid protein